MMISNSSQLLINCYGFVLKNNHEMNLDLVIPNLRFSVIPQKPFYHVNQRCNSFDFSVKKNRQIEVNCALLS